MTQSSARFLLAVPLLAFLAAGWLLPASGAAAAPAISGYAATLPRGVPIFSAPPGAPMLIEGTNLGSSGTVAFNGIPAPPAASWSPTEILVIVPAAPSYPFQGPITVTTGGQTAKGPTFTITPPPPPVPPRPGDLDAGFGTNGTVLTDFGESSGARAAALQPDGQIVAAGFSVSGGQVQFALARFNANGTLDRSFSTGGRVLTDFGGDGAEADALALQPDGRIVAAGSSTAGRKTELALARYNADGSLDRSFGAGGKVLADFGGNSGGSAVALQPDGWIVVAGWSDAGGSPSVVLARYSANGSPDPSFGKRGQVQTDFGDAAGASALALQPDGQIIVAGGSVLARFTASGALDAGFGSGGVMLTDFLGSAMMLQPDGRIVLAGSDFGLIRYHADGSLDHSFGTGGKVLTDVRARAVAVQPDGRIVVAGQGFTLARYNADGSPDASFGAGGTVLTRIGNNSAWAYAVALQPDGQVVLAGAANDAGGTGHFALARYRGR